MSSVREDNGATTSIVSIAPVRVLDSKVASGDDGGGVTVVVVVMPKSIKN